MNDNDSLERRKCVDRAWSGNSANGEPWKLGTIAQGTDTCHEYAEYCNNNSNMVDSGRRESKSGEKDGTNINISTSMGDIGYKDAFHSPVSATDLGDPGNEWDDESFKMGAGSMTSPTATSTTTYEGFGDPLSSPRVSNWWSDIELGEGAKGPSFNLEHYRASPSASASSSTWDSILNSVSAKICLGEINPSETPTQRDLTAGIPPPTTAISSTLRAWWTTKLFRDANWGFTTLLFEKLKSYTASCCGFGRKALLNSTTKTNPVLEFVVHMNQEDGQITHHTNTNIIPISGRDYNTTIPAMTYTTQSPNSTDPTVFRNIPVTKYATLPTPSSKPRTLTPRTSSLPLPLGGSYLASLRSRNKSTRLLVPTNTTIENYVAPPTSRYPSSQVESVTTEVHYTTKCDTNGAPFGPPATTAFISSSDHSLKSYLQRETTETKNALYTVFPRQPGRSECYHTPVIGPITIIDSPVVLSSTQNEPIRTLTTNEYPLENSTRNNLVMFSKDNAEILPNLPKDQTRLEVIEEDDEWLDRGVQDNRSTCTYVEDGTTTKQSHTNTDTPSINQGQFTHIPQQITYTPPGSGICPPPPTPTEETHDGFTTMIDRLDGLCSFFDTATRSHKTQEITNTKHPQPSLIVHSPLTTPKTVNNLPGSCKNVGPTTDPQDLKDKLTPSTMKCHTQSSLKIYITVPPPVEIPVTENMAGWNESTYYDNFL